MYKINCKQHRIAVNFILSMERKMRIGIVDADLISRKNTGFQIWHL